MQSLNELLLITPSFAHQVDPNDVDNLTVEQLNIINDNYASFIPEEDSSGYKSPENQFVDGYHNYIDLTIYHPKYGGKYNDHEPIDLPQFYCTMSSAGFKHLADAWRYAMGQPRANQIGPLGKRAGTHKCLNDVFYTPPVE